MESSKKVHLDELSKEEILEKYANALNLLKKAKQSKDSLVKEINELKDVTNKNEEQRIATNEVIERLTQQKLTLTTTMEEFKLENKKLCEKLKMNEEKLLKVENKFAEVDTANESFKRQIKRLTEDNEILLMQLDELTKKHNDDIKEKNEKLENLELISVEKDKNLLLIGNELMEMKQVVDVLKIQLNEKQDESNSLRASQKRFEEKIEDLENTLKKYQTEITKQQNEFHKVKNHMPDEVHAEMHKNRALIETLKIDLKTTNEKLNENQILCSGVTSDLENLNEKLKDKVKLYHSKLIKFAGELKEMKNTKNNLLTDFKTYIEQVNLWKNQLNELSKQLLLNIEQCEEENKILKRENNCYKVTIRKIEEDNENMKKLLNNTANNEEMNVTVLNLRENLKRVEDELSEMKIQRDQYENEKNNLEKEMTNAREENVSLRSQIDEFTQMQRERDILIREKRELIKNVEEQEKILKEHSLCIEERKKLFEEKNSLIQENQKLINEKENDIKVKTVYIIQLEEDISDLKSKCEQLNIEHKQQMEKILINQNKLFEENNILLKEKQELIEAKERNDEIVIKNKNDYITQLEKEIDAMKIKCEKLNNEHENKIEELLSIQNKLIEEKNILLKEKEILLKNKENYDMLVKDHSILLEECNKMKNDIETKTENVSILKNKNVELQSECDKISSDLKEMIKFKNKVDEELLEMGKIKSENKELQVNIQNLQTTLQKIEEKVNVEKNDINTQTENEYIDKKIYEDKVMLLTQENQELLSEMNEMNQALKERGETISKQMIYCDELLKKVQEYETQFNKYSEMITEKDKKIKFLEENISDLRNDMAMKINLEEENGEARKKEELVSQLMNEIQTLKDKLNSLNESNCDETETMSTSTISRTDETNRLKDLEGSWEERYGKLRSLAIKQKGKIRELTSELSKEQSERSEIQNKLASSLKNVQSLQNQCDKLQDELDECKKECKDYSKRLENVAHDVSKDKQLLVKNEEIINALKVEIENYKKEKSNTDSWKKQVSAKVQTLKKELEANVLLKREYENKIKQLEADLEQKEKTLRTEMEKHKQTRNSLLESNNECKKQSVLNLEMQDYERSVKDLTQKLEKKQELIGKLKNQIDSQKSTINTLKEQNRLLEEQTQCEEKDLLSANVEINLFKKKINDLEALLMEKDSKINDALDNLERIRMENEDLSTQLSRTVSEHQKIIENLKSEKDHLRNVNLGLERKLREVEDKNKLNEEEFAKIKKDYEAYKIRAQSVLKQNQNRDYGLEEKLTEEIESLRAQIDVLKKENDEIKSTIAICKNEKECLLSEKQKVESDFNEIKVKAEDFETQLQQLNKKYQQTINEHAETVRGLKIHADTLSQCYKKQLSDLEEKHNKEIVELQNKIEKSTPQQEVPLLIPTMPREEGEGSESVDSSVTSSTQPIPLEKLLSIDYDHEIVNLRKVVAENESKVSHLTALLADTEQDLVKHVQMNKLLKEEIRRQQRSVEREKHAENLEYLKNVVFKFVTLGNGDERTRLIPVLSTILKLSPEEVQKLNLMTKSEKSWSNYLPLWSGPSKPQ